MCTLVNGWVSALIYACGGNKFAIQLFPVVQGLYWEFFDFLFKKCICYFGSITTYHNLSHHCCQNSLFAGCKPCGCQCTPQNCTWNLQAHRWVQGSCTSPRVRQSHLDSLYNHHIHTLMGYKLHSGRWIPDWNRCCKCNWSHHCRPHSHSHGHSWGAVFHADYRFYTDFENGLICIVNEKRDKVNVGSLEKHDSV